MVSLAAPAQASKNDEQVKQEVVSGLMGGPLGMPLSSAGARIFAGEASARACAWRRQRERVTHSRDFCQAPKRLNACTS